MNLLKTLFEKNRHLKNSNENDQINNTLDNKKKEPLNINLQQNIQMINQKTGSSTDIVIKELYVNENESSKLCVIYTDGMTDKKYMQDFIIETLSKDLLKGTDASNILSKQDSIKAIKDIVLTVGDIEQINDFEVLFKNLFSGKVVILVDGYIQGLTVDVRGYKDRGVTEPTSQTVIRGPKDGFSETLRTNTSLVRRRIKDPNLWIETRSIGEKTKTDVAILYMKGIADDKIIQEVYSRLDKIEIDGIYESSYIEEFIQDKNYSPFPTVLNTERPDTVAAGLVEGRVAIMVDGTPFVLLAPVVFSQFFQSPEDYYSKFDISSLIRILRFTCFLFALLIPATYVAVTTFHQEMIPTTLLTSLAAQREAVPFPAAIEALLMELAFEILREAGVRMPRVIGAAMSIVGALVLGQAAVEAGIVSAIMVIIVSLTAICSFVSPIFSMSMAVRMIRFVFLLLGATFGLFGIALGLIVMVLHLCSLNSFGIPYLYPMGPFNLKDQKDVIIRAPLKKMLTRPRLINEKNIVRQRKISKMGYDPMKSGKQS